jgi:hypothetical protein
MAEETVAVWPLPLKLETLQVAERSGQHWFHVEVSPHFSAFATTTTTTFDAPEPARPTEMTTLV